MKFLQWIFLKWLHLLATHCQSVRAGTSTCWKAGPASFFTFNLRKSIEDVGFVTVVFDFFPISILSQLTKWQKAILYQHGHRTCHHSTKGKKKPVVVSQWLKVIGVWWNMNWNLIFSFHFQMSLISQEMFGVWRNYMKIWATASDTVRAAILENLPNQQGSGIMSKKNTLFLMWLEVFLTVLTRAIWWYCPCAICSACGSLIANENHGRQTLIDPSKTEWNRVPRKLPVIHDFGIRWNRRKTTSHSLRGKKQNTD